MDFPFRTLGFILLFGLLLKYRGRIRARLELLADRVGNPESNSFGDSLEAVVHTLFLALPLPLALYLMGRVLAASDDSFLVDGGDALRWVAGVTGLLELARHWLRPRGFAEAHLGWSSDVMGPIGQQLLRPQILFLPLLYVALHLGFSGISPNAPAELQAYSKSLGRLAFMIATAGLGIYLGRILGRRQGGQWLNPQVSIYALPVITMSLLVPAVLAAVGFYVTGLLLALSDAAQSVAGRRNYDTGGTVLQMACHLFSKAGRAVLFTAHHPGYSRRDGKRAGRSASPAGRRGSCRCTRQDSSAGAICPGGDCRDRTVCNLV